MLFCCLSYSSFGHWELFHIDSLLFWCPIPLQPPKSIFLLLGTTRQFRLVVFLYQLWNQPLLQGALVTLIREQYLENKIWVLGVLTATWVSLPPVPLWVELGKLYVCITNLCIHTWNYYFYICLSVRNHEFILMPLTPSQQQRVHSSLYPFLVTFFSLDSEKPGSHYL